MRSITVETEVDVYLECERCGQDYVCLNCDSSSYLNSADYLVKEIVKFFKIDYLTLEQQRDLKSLLEDGMLHGKERLEREERDFQNRVNQFEEVKWKLKL